MLRALVGGIVLFAAMISAGCGSNDPDRYAYHTMRARGIFGDTGRLSLTISPGIVTECEEPPDDDTIIACARASGPLPMMRVTNGGLEEAGLLLEIANTAPDGRWAVYLEPLLESEPQDQRCIRDGLGPAPGLSTRLADAEGARLQVLIPPCAALVLDAQLPLADAQEDYLIVVWGGGTARDSELQTALTMMEEAGVRPDFIWFLDLLALRSSVQAFDALDEAMQEAGVPWGILASEGALNRGSERFIDRFGALDFVTRVHGVPLIALDTASWTISSSQIAFVRRIRTCDAEECPPAIALMNVPPVSVGRLDVGIFRSQAVAQNLLSAFSQRGVRWLVSSSERRYEATTFGGFQLRDVGRWRGVRELVTIEISPPEPDRLLCDAGLSLLTSDMISVTAARTFCPPDHACLGGVCVASCSGDLDCGGGGGGRCVEGLCRADCESDACPSGRCDAEGFCRHGPQVEVHRVELGAP